MTASAPEQRWIYECREAELAHECHTESRAQSEELRVYSA